MIRLHNLGSRSRILSKLVEALTQALEEIGEGSIKRISLNVEYFNDEKIKNVTVSLIP